MKKIKILNENTLKDAMYNMSVDCAKTDSNKAYGKGILVGIVACLMAQGYTFDYALSEAKKYAPRDYVDSCVPPSWVYDFSK